MKKNKIFIVASLAALLAVFSACDSSNDQSKSSSDDPDNVSESTDESKDSLDNDKELSEGNEDNKQDVNVEEKSTENSNQTAVAEKNENENRENTKTEQTTNTDENEKNSSEPKETIQISSGEEAVQYLKQQLKEGKDDDVSFGSTETPSTDDYGSYYTIQLVDVPTRVSGKTGTLATYKVYQDGTYKDFYDDLS